MKKYVLNIEKLYTGQTANALVLNQVDEDFPVLLPSMPERARNVAAWIERCKKWNPEFDVEYVVGMTPAQLNPLIIDFNLSQQVKFKEKGHQELYMMDDTKPWKPGDESKTVQSDKTFLHCINGKSIVEEDDPDNGKQSVAVNSSQMNVLFPFKKMTSKSLYASQLKVESALDIDDKLERSRGITLQGKVSKEKCLQEVTQAGNNLYMMSTNLPIGRPNNNSLLGNSLTFMNGVEFPYTFPNSMTLFQPSQDQYEKSSVKAFVEWYEKHDRKTRVKLNDTYGGNVTTLKYLGPGSYDLVLATYSPTNIVLKDGTPDELWIDLDSSTFREKRSVNDGTYEKGQYVFDNGKKGDVGLMFNMYDTFITGRDRILKMSIPKDKDFNKLILKFEWRVLTELIGDVEAVVEVNENKVPGEDPSSDKYSSSSKFRTYEFDISDAATKEHDIEIVVRIHYDVDFGRRNTDHEYRENLKRSGVLLRNIRIDNGISEPPERLTFGSYVNEDGISDEVRKERQRQFWIVSQYKRNMTYQTVLESPLKNSTTAGIKYPNNYSSGDLYGDVFVTKSALDPKYDMNMTADVLNPDILNAIGRDYIGMDSCSNQLSLFYKPTDILIDANRTNVVKTTRNESSPLKYQMVEVVKNINRFESSIKHKSNVFSVVIENSNLTEDTSDNSDEVLEKYKKQLRDSVTQFVRNTCEGIVPVHTQLFDVQFT